AEPSDERIAYRVRYLLGRRLARSGRYSEAAAYLPGAARAHLRDFADSLTTGREAGRSDDERARRLLRAACLARYRGMEMFGTEIDPDWSAYGGSFDTGSFYDERANPGKHPHT